MFGNLTERFVQVLKRLGNKGQLTEENMSQALREISISLLEADVALTVVKDFIEKIKQKYLGQKITQNLSPVQFVTKLVYDELSAMMGDTRAELNLKTQAPAVFLIAGLQGSGKTTSAAKLALYLKDHEKKKVMLVSVDVYRPAAIQQLNILADEAGVDFFPALAHESPLDIAAKAIDSAKKQFMDIIIIDTAGRLHLDEEMMAEIKSLHLAVHPIETLFVVDSMTGQDAAITAKAFSEALALTGIILTKTDGDARGGAALSVRQITGQAIKFIGSGEKITALEAFYPDRIASRILGMGDMLTLIEEVEKKTDKAISDKLAQKLRKGREFDLNDFKAQLLQMNNMGIKNMINKLPQGMSVPIPNEINDKSLNQSIAIIDSMTMKERRIPKIIIGSRKRRIALGSGTEIPNVNRILKQFTQVQKMMQKISKPGGAKRMMGGMAQIPQLANIKGLISNKEN